MAIFYLPIGCSLDRLIMNEDMTHEERVEMAWQVLRMACEVAGIKAPLNPLAPKLETALAEGISHFFNDFEEPYDRKINFIKMVRSVVYNYNINYGAAFNSGLREVKQFADRIFNDKPFSSSTSHATCVSYLRLMDFEDFFKA